ncbi:hypothetical protein [Acetobacter senegalensis]|uniref:hypothetical protein n=1 Tax=Acetobacter senegalensis TaxID=446692 RepID=UPI001EDA4053|nr:hypothetical protein [Acetobacter senegalensis]MCG4258042.1 hypothetical protein [Acetobacter senegalensis]MCG4267969.1 hypothetical protein [Acetobacter senegalensis]
MNAFHKISDAQTNMDRARSRMRLAERLFSEADRFDRFSRTCRATGKLDDAATWKKLAATCRTKAEIRLRQAKKTMGIGP